MRINNLDIVTLQEPRISGSKGLDVIRRLGFQYHLIVEARGFSGGIWILWNRPDLSITSIQSHEQFLHVKITDDVFSPWFLTVIYASPRAAERNELWDNMLNLSYSISAEWLVIGDFNEIAAPSEKKGGGPVDLSRCDIFSTGMNEC